MRPLIFACFLPIYELIKNALESSKIHRNKLLSKINPTWNICRLLHIKFIERLHFFTQLLLFFLTVCIIARFYSSFIPPFKHRTFQMINFLKLLLHWPFCVPPLSKSKFLHGTIKLNLTSFLDTNSSSWSHFHFLHWCNSHRLIPAT